MEGEPSATAKITAVARGLHRLEHAPPWVLDDPFALLLVGREWTGLRAAMHARFPPAVGDQATAFTVVRSRYAEDRLEAGGFDQYCVLGAGLDSFVWRRPDLCASSWVFEVDHPASQRWKRERAASLCLPECDHHLYVPVDFERDSLHDALTRSGFDWSRRAFFSWLGVVGYLTVESVEATLRCVAGGAPGAEIVLTYPPTPPHLDEIGQAFRAVMEPIAASSGETQQTRIEPDAVVDLVRRCGLDVADHPDRDDLAARYFAGRRDGLLPYTAERLITAAVPG